jgi:putative ABC transport system permease protein
VRILDIIAGKLPLFTPYLALRQLSRQSQNYLNPLLLVIVALALGVYTVSMAASMDRWLQDRVYYSVGSDLAVTPFTDALGIGGDWIPTTDEFEDLPGVAAAARVGDYEAVIYPSGSQGTSYDGRFLGVDRIELPDAIWYRNDLARESLGALMNRLAATPDGVLVSQDFLSDNGLHIGDKIHLIVMPEPGSSIRDQFTIVGVYDHFPTVYEDEPAVIGNLEYIFSYFGISLLHDIWLRTEEGVSGADIWAEIHDQLGIDLVNRRDAAKQLADEQAVMERIGVFGTLSVSFVAAALMAAVGLLTYSYASLNERLFQFSVLRAIGLGRTQIAGQVALEYAILTAFGAVMGVLCGLAAAALFVPLFRVSSGPTAPLPPLVPVFAPEQVIVLAVLFASLMILLEVLVISSTFRNSLFRALRLGHTT